MPISENFLKEGLTAQNWVVEVEKAKIRYIRQHPDEALIWFETDMLFLRDPVPRITKGFSQQVCDAILLYGEGTVGNVNTGLSYYRSSAGALLMMSKTVKLLLKQGKHSQLKGGENQQIVADMGFGGIRPGSSRTKFHCTVCSQRLSAIQLFSIYRWKRRSPNLIYQEALRQNVSVIHFNGPASIKELIFGTSELLPLKVSSLGKKRI